MLISDVQSLNQINQIWSCIRKKSLIFALLHQRIGPRVTTTGVVSGLITGEWSGRLRLMTSGGGDDITECVIGIVVDPRILLTGLGVNGMIRFISEGMLGWSIGIDVTMLHDKWWNG